MLKEIQQKDLGDIFERSLLPRLWVLLARDDVDGLIIYRNINLSSSQLGMASAVAFGPGCSILKSEDMPPWINDLPSERQHPESILRKASTSSTK